MEDSDLGEIINSFQRPNYIDIVHLVGIIMLSEENILPYKLWWGLSDRDWLKFLLLEH